MRLFFLLPILILINNAITAQEIDDRYYETTNFSFLRDTVYTLKPYFIEVNLKTQKGYLHSRQDSTIEFGVSTGTRWAKDGVDTKEGLFVIQSMMPKWHSRQFDSTLMLNWMGFNYGIGFHALLGKSYYRYLGVKRSSHGCVRLSREMAEYIYSRIELGTPVLVHSENNAVIVSFIDSSKSYKFFTSDTLYEILKSRYQQSYNGRYFLQDKEPIIIDSRNVSHPGLPIGSRKYLPKRQILKPDYKFISAITPEAKSVQEIEIFPTEDYEMITTLEYSKE